MTRENEMMRALAGCAGIGAIAVVIVGVLLVGC